MKLNCDMGESENIGDGSDTAVMPYVDMSNIACGFHASNPQVMAYTVDLAIKQGVSIGAHPGYPDLDGFGRNEMTFSFDELVNIVLYQVGALHAICQAKNTTVDYVKPHGALYNMMMRDITIYRALLTAVSAFSSSLLPPHKSTMPLVIMATPNGQTYADIAKEFGVPVLFEAFCDRAYTDEGLLQPRQDSGAVYDSIDAMVMQAKQLIHQQCVVSCTGKSLSVKADTICIHGDGALALDAVKHIREILKQQ